MATITISFDGVLRFVGTAALGAAAAGLVAYYCSPTPAASGNTVYDAAKGIDPDVNVPKKIIRVVDDSTMKNIPAKVSTQIPSMEDIVRSRQIEASELETTTPSMVLQKLQQGNARFWMGIAQRPEMSAMERRAQIIQQYPKAAILGCSDSRVPIEIIFDQGLGDIFAIRVAGNSYGTGVAASIDYAVTHLKVKLVVVLGHEGCGAVRAAMLPYEQIEQEPAHLRKWLTFIRRGLMVHDGLNQGVIQDLRARDREAVITNVRAQLAQIAKDTSLMQRVNEGSLMVVGAFYEITSGMVDFIGMDGKMTDGNPTGQLQPTGGKPLSDKVAPPTPANTTPASTSPVTSPVITRRGGSQPPSGGRLPPAVQPAISIPASSPTSLYDGGDRNWARPSTPS